MAQPYVGEIRMFAGNFAPLGWAFCNGALVPISENETLFNLIGTSYGGDGQNTFALPDLQGRLPVHVGGGFPLAACGGVESVTLTTNQIPAHGHPALTTTHPGDRASPSLAYLADQGPAGITSVFSYNPYDAANQVSLKPAVISTAGASQPHSNMQPYLCVNFIISLFGIFPSQG